MNYNYGKSGKKEKNPSKKQSKKKKLLMATYKKTKK